MKKLLIIGLSFFAFACGNNNTTNTEGDANATENDATVPEEVEIGAGSQRNPQLEFESDSNEIFDVDTVTTTKSLKKGQEGF